MYVGIAGDEDVALGVGEGYRGGRCSLSDPGLGFPVSFEWGLGEEDGVRAEEALDNIVWAVDGLAGVEVGLQMTFLFFVYAGVGVLEQWDVAEVVELVAFEVARVGPGD